MLKTCKAAMENGSQDMHFIRVDKKYLGEDDIVRLEDRYGRVE